MEIYLLHRAVGDSVQARAELVVDVQTNRVPNDFIAVNRAQEAPLLLHIS